MQLENKQKYIVYDKTIETSDVSTLRLIPSTENFPYHIPGQFITIYFPEIGTPEGKAYSISSVPSEHVISISVKAMGEFSRRLTKLEAGDTLTASLPYGYFYSESTDSSLVMIAAGIGIAPFRSMIIDALEKNHQRKITVFYSVRMLTDIIFKKELDKIESQYKNFNIKYFITRQKNIDTGMNDERITGKKILENIDTIVDSEFLICGSISFTRDIWRDLRAQGISEDHILTEAFFGLKAFLGC